MLILNTTLATTNYKEYLEIEDKILYKSIEAFNTSILFTDGSLIEDCERDINIITDDENIKNTISIITSWKHEVKDLMQYSTKKNKLKKRLPSFTFFSSPKEDSLSIKNEAFIITINAKTLEINGFIKINE